jgi:hypothetical protein
MSDAPLRRYGVAHREEIGATEYGAEHLVEHDERGVRENDLRLAGERNQRCKATWSPRNAEDAERLQSRIRW